ncbi:SNARE-interacting protein KEULE-like isoform X1 [Magnolia sinica]|uniref:SNARE-interacting protein KEULE-like isoform X1 n=1 Tax=Magnolia sinica TaxID=86752 RepID=UPI0026583E95|nr:SNARE-interacting protein KEULE-like isoform X1 [Magnolia sinica]
MLDSDSNGEYKTFRQISRDRLLHEMLQSTKVGDCRSTWKVLIMDKITVKVMSSSCKMADITDEGVSLVEDLYKRRQPLPSMDAIYFIHPSKENVVFFISDMSGRCPLYKKAYVFFSSPIPKDFVSMIKNDTSVLPRIGALREVKLISFLKVFVALNASINYYWTVDVFISSLLFETIICLIVISPYLCERMQMNLEYFSIDSQGFVTDNDTALEELFGEKGENSRTYDACLNMMATRIATVFASLKELPSVRYRAAKSSLEESTMTTFRDLVPTKLAAAVWNFLTKYKSTIPNFPQTETCELLILDRTVDQIAPVIHEWTYDAMCHDLLEMDGNKYVYESSKSGGEPEKKEVILEDHDPVWLELRHAHIADASERLHDKMTNFVSKNKAAQIHSRDGSELSTRDLQKMVQALPQYSDQMEKLSLHVEIAGKVNKLIRDLGLRDLGQLEQDLVFGDAGTKEVITFLRTKQDTTPENKLRLLMIYAVIYPEKFEADKGAKLMQLARLPLADLDAINNMRYLVGSDNKKASGGGFSLKFDVHKKKNAARKERSDEEETWQLSRFYPVIEELITKLSKGELPKNEYPCMNDPSPTSNGTAQGQGVSARTGQVPPAHSMRSRRTATWARPRNSDDGSSSDSVLRQASSDFKRMGQRIFIFIVGGATRSELRVVHKLTKKLSREIVLGSSSLDDPPQFIQKVKSLSGEELSVDDIHI